MSVLFNAYASDLAPLTPLFDLDLTGPTLPAGSRLTRSGGHATGRDDTGDYFLVSTSDTPVFSKGFNGGTEMALQLREGVAGFAINQTAAGAVVGTPGTFPTDWLKTDSGSQTFKVYEVGTRNGLPGVGIEFSGSSSGANTTRQIRFNPAFVVPMPAAGTTITFSVFIQRDLTADPKVTWELDLVYCDAAGTETSSSTNVPLSVPVGGNLVDCRFSISQLFSTTSVKSVRPRLTANVNASGTVTEKIFIAMPQPEYGFEATDPLANTTAGGSRNDERFNVYQLSNGDPLPVGYYDILITADGLDTWQLNQSVLDETGVSIIKLPNGSTSMTRVRGFPAGAVSSTRRRSLSDDVLPDPILGLYADSGVTLGDGNTVSSWASPFGSGVATQATPSLRPAQVDFQGVKFLEVSSGDVMDLTGVTFNDDMTVIIAALSSGTGRMTLLGCENAANGMQIEINSQGAGTVGEIAFGTFVMTSQAVPVDGKPIVAAMTKNATYTRMDLNGESDVELLNPAIIVTYTDPATKKLFRRAASSQLFAGYVGAIEIYSPALNQAQTDRRVRELVQKYRFELTPGFQGLTANQLADAPGFTAAVDLPSLTPVQLAVATDANFTSIVAQIDPFQQIEVECSDTTKRYPAKYLFDSTKGALSSTAYWYSPMINGTADVARANKITTNPAVGSTARVGMLYNSCVKTVSSPMVVLIATVARAVARGTTLYTAFFDGDVGYQNAASTDVKVYRLGGLRKTLGVAGIKAIRTVMGWLNKRNDHETRNDGVWNDGAHIALENAAFIQSWKEITPHHDLWDSESRVIGFSFQLARTGWVCPDTTSQKNTAYLSYAGTSFGNGNNPPGSYDQFSKVKSEILRFNADPNVSYICLALDSGFPDPIHNGMREVAPEEFTEMMDFIGTLEGAKPVLGFTGDFHSMHANSHIDYSTLGGAQMPTFMLSCLYSTVIDTDWTEHATLGNWCGADAGWYESGQQGGYVEFEGDTFRVECWGGSLTKPKVGILRGVFTESGYAVDGTETLISTPRTITFSDGSVASGAPFELVLTRAGIPPVGGCYVDYVTVGKSGGEVSGTIFISATRSNNLNRPSITSTTSYVINFSNPVRCVLSDTQLAVTVS